MEHYWGKEAVELQGIARGKVNTTIKLVVTRGERRVRIVQSELGELVLRFTLDNTVGLLTQYVIYNSGNRKW